MQKSPASFGLNAVPRQFSISTGFVGRLAALLVLLLTLSAVLGACGPNPTEQSGPTPTVSSALKIQTALVNLFITYQTAPGTDEDKKNAAIQYARENQILNAKDEAVFELTIEPAEREKPITDKVNSMGGKVRNVAVMDGTVKMRISVPVDVFLKYSSSANKDNFLADLAAFDGVKYIDLINSRQIQELQNLPDSPAALEAMYQVSRNEGVRLMGADKWQAAGFKGKGAKVGIIDGGFKYYKKFLGTTLPADLEIKDVDEEFGGSGVIDEDVHGTAVLEIIYSLAPEATFAAAAIDGSDGELKSAIDYLVAQGSNVISVSLGGHGSAGDGSAPIDRYIETVRKTKGVVFLFSSGNEGSAHYTGFFNPDTQGFHQFLPGVTRMAVGNARSTTLPTFFILNWEQWSLPRSQVNDLDIVITDQDGTIVKSSSDSQSVRPPAEQVPFTLKSKGLYYIRVRQKPGTPSYTKPFRVHLFGHNTTFQFIVPQMSVADPADSKGALGVGAIQWQEDKWAYYSSQGPLPDGRLKPELSAPAGVTSRAYQEEGRDVFDGTSAACPEAAGIATILKGANPALSADELEALLKEAVKDLSPAGVDYANGYGRLSLADLQPAQGIKPQGKAVAAPTVNTANLQFPILVYNGYPAPKVEDATSSKVGAPTPLPTRVGRPQDGATDDSKPDAAGKINPTPVPNTVAPTKSIPGPSVSPGAKTTPTTGPDLPPVNNVTFSDNFKDTTSGLPNTGNAAYANGSYKLKAGPNQLTWSAYPPSTVSVSDFGAEVTAQGIGDRQGLYGIVFWYTDPNNYYLLSVSGTGQYQVSQYSGGSYREVIPWNTSAGWKAGASNLLRLVAINSTISVSLNGQPGKAGQAQGQGSVGFAAGSYGNSVEATYSNFKLSSGK